jgi:nucleotide-binding universal stress UspA family protein
VVLCFGYEPPGGVGEEIKVNRDLAREIGERATTRGRERAQAKGVEVEVELVEERPVAALMKLAEARDARAIVVATQGEHPIKGAILGSVAQKLVHQSERPVLVVPVPE